MTVTRNEYNIWPTYDVMYGPFEYSSCRARKSVRAGPFLATRLKRGVRRAIRKHDRRVAKNELKNDVVKALNDAATLAAQKTGRDG